MLSELKNIYHFCLAWLGSFIYRHPSQKLTVIGITGTKGKTSSAELLHAVLQNNGIKTALLSSAHIAFGDKKEISPTGNTMPGRFFIQRFLRGAIKEGCTHAVFEVTSQGVAQHRHRFIDFDVAALTNLHPEHIESHGSYEKYRSAKASFFSYVANASVKVKKSFFVNADCKDKSYFAEAAKGVAVEYSGEAFIAETLGGDTSKVSGWLRSNFNLENAALVYAIAKDLGLEKEATLKTFADFSGVPGRLEFLHGAGRTAVIDAALTPESLRALYLHLKTITGKQGGRLIAIFGSAGGGRDIWKRPELGKIASEFCDEIYLTSDDNYDEDPKEIIKEIGSGIQNNERVKVVISRKEAIRQALAGAEQNDIVAITGMGSQVNTYGPGGRKIPWSDRQVVVDLLKAI